MQIRNGFLLLFMAMMLIRCAARRSLMPTPNLYATGQQELFTSLLPPPPEDVYLYRVRMPPARARRFFLSYVEKINALKAHPEFYNTLLTNCPTNRVRVTAKELRDGWKVALMEM